ncbi:CesT family type III secretion system chaperone [Noviherbaspirillum suwonense]|uniref:Tir chaperone protein (CesT) family protein n=1 Tax=Noviherbaspirillum suwonense TaxID=1224511 RepID=A0ABY1PSK7_9BURK|nr:CesT family type III secretion system chaperone [Noviherbaspirillum suwonense]SMP44880.1 Tir chaperone protein (CesT) family protein [Noviherbaspirillum suwonense]
MVTSALHPELARYLAAEKADQASRSPDGSISMVFDAQYRVTCQVFAQGDLLLEARVLRLPDDEGSRTTTVEMLLEQAGQRLQDHAEWLALGSGGQILMLQQIVPAQADRIQFSNMLDSFVNALAGWRRLAGVL